MPYNTMGNYNYIRDVCIIIDSVVSCGWNKERLDRTNQPT